MNWRQYGATVWTGLNWGGGSGYLYGDRRGPVYRVFIGLPIDDNSPFQRLRAQSFVI